MDLPYSIWNLRLINQYSLASTQENKQESELDKDMKNYDTYSFNFLPIEWLSSFFIFS